MKKESGITLIALVITIIVILIITGITVYEGSKIVKEARIQTVISDMLIVKSKVKGYIEEVDAKTWAETNNNKFNEMLTNTENYGLNIINSVDDEFQQQLEEKNNVIYYGINSAGKIGSELKDTIDWKESDCPYIVTLIKENGENAKIVIDIIYKNGVSYKGNTYYVLSALEKAVEE